LGVFTQPRSIPEVQTTAPCTAQIGHDESSGHGLQFFRERSLGGRVRVLGGELALDEYSQAYLSTTVATAAASRCHIQIRTQKPPITHFAPHRQISAAIEKFLAGLPHAPLPMTGLGGFSGSARRDLDPLRGAQSRTGGADCKKSG
jgi:hypothetical protein